MQDYSKAITSALKKEGAGLYLIGERADELGGSVYYELNGELGGNVPKIDFDKEKQRIWSVIGLIDKRLLLSCHDISDGGLGVALAEMIMGGYARGTLGASIDIAPLGSDLRSDKVLFSESGGFVLEVVAGREAQLEALFSTGPLQPIAIGEVSRRPALEVQGRLSLGIEQMADAWTKGLASRLR